jgi:hypothetical protein
VKRAASRKVVSSDLRPPSSTRWKEHDAYSWLAKRVRMQQQDNAVPVLVPEPPGGFAAAEERERWRDAHDGGWASGEVSVL